MADVRAANTPREDRFDRLTDLAKEIFGVNMALITIVDSDRQWFKSTCGLGGVNETPRDAGFLRARHFRARRDGDSGCYKGCTVCR